MKEIWKDIVGYRGLYQVSNLGKVRRTKILKTRKDKNGYVYITLCKNGKVKCGCIHRLVATAFIENPLGKEQVNHKDGIRNNNIVNNLEWVTVSENHKYSYKYLGKTNPRPMTGKFGKEHNLSKSFKLLFPNGKIEEFFSGLEFTRKTGGDHTSISYARKQGVPYKFSRGILKGCVLIEA